MDAVVRTDTDNPLRRESALSAEAVWSGVSWGSIAAGAVAAAALALALLALGAGLGLSSISPWADSGVSASTFKIGAGIYLVIVAVMSSAVGGYLAARLRSKWVGLHTNEVFFRDTAHGFIAWAFATLLSAGVLGAATTHIVAGATAGLGSGAAQTAQSVNPSQIYVDRLFRPATATPAAGATAGAAGSNEAARAEATRLWAATVGQNSELLTPDRAYLARLVATQTGLNQADAEKRVDEVIAEAKAAADRARSAAAKLAFWMTASLLFGAFAASLAAAEGGQMRDGTWQDRRLVPRPW
jgi:hypothetical protein